jgi:hypothetical protein
MGNKKNQWPILTVSPSSSTFADPVANSSLLSSVSSSPFTCAASSLVSSTAWSIMKSKLNFAQVTYGCCKPHDYLTLQISIT